MQPDQQPTPQPQPETQQTTPVSPTSTPETPQTPPASPSMPPTGKKKLPLWAKILLLSFGSVIGLIGLAALGFFIFATVQMSGPIKVSNQFVDAFQANDASQAYDLTSSEFKFVTKEARLKSIFDQVSSEVQGEEKISDKHLSIHNGVKTATVVYRVDSSGGTSYIRVTLREKEDKWEVREMFVSKNELKANKA